jgi:hypothetical protein
MQGMLPVRKSPTPVTPALQAGSASRKGALSTACELRDATPMRFKINQVWTRCTLRTATVAMNAESSRAGSASGARLSKAVWRLPRALRSWWRFCSERMRDAPRTQRERQRQFSHEGGPTRDALAKCCFEATGDEVTAMYCRLRLFFCFWWFVR